MLCKKRTSKIKLTIHFIFIKGDKAKQLPSILKKQVNIGKHNLTKPENHQQILQVEPEKGKKKTTTLLDKYLKVHWKYFKT